MNSIYFELNSVKTGSLIQTPLKVGYNNLLVFFDMSCLERSEGGGGERTK